MERTVNAMTMEGQSAMETLQEAMEKMDKGGEYGPFNSIMVSMTRGEIQYLLDRLDEMSFEQAWGAGYEYGYQQAIKDMGKRIKEMKTYGGDKQKKRAFGVPEHYEGRAGDLQQDV
jgi:hypothetical protein